jgi:hypothetical protein
VNRRDALASLAGAAGSLAAAPVLADDEKPPVPGAYPFFSTGKEISVNLASKPVSWKGSDYTLVHIGKARFFISSLGRLTGILNGAVTTFDSVDYDVHAAVFDAQARLLGTARAVCSVERVWLGAVGTSPVELRLDFGVSEAFKRGEWFTLGITERKVLTPDDWAKPK